MTSPAADIDKPAVKGPGFPEFVALIAMMMALNALAIDAMLEAADHSLSRPLQLALSHDEEIGCVGVRRLLDVLHLAPVRPFLCLIGEPTNMQFVLGHKGKGSYRTYCRGLEAHSSLAPLSVNAALLKLRM